jgi:hypothetical protein
VSDKKMPNSAFSGLAIFFDTSDSTQTKSSKANVPMKLAVVVRPNASSPATGFC